MTRVDFFPTPQAVIDQIIPHAICTLHNKRQPSVLEPCAGDGRILYALHEQVKDAKLVAVEQHHVIPYSDCVYEAHIGQDFLTWQTKKQFDLIITNPPFSLVSEFIKKSYDLLKIGGSMFFLARLGILAGQKRHRDLWTKFPPSNIYVMPKRPSFIGNGTDRYDLAWFHWTKLLTPTVETPLLQWLEPI